MWQQLTSIWLDCINIFSTIFHHWHFKFCWISHCVLCDNCRVGGAWANSFLNLKIKRHLWGIIIITTVKSFRNILQLSDFTLLLFSWTPPGSFSQEPPASFTIQLWTLWKVDDLWKCLLCGKCHMIKCSAQHLTNDVHPPYDKMLTNNVHLPYDTNNIEII